MEIIIFYRRCIVIIVNSPYIIKNQNYTDGKDIIETNLYIQLKKPNLYIQLNRYRNYI